MKHLPLIFSLIASASFAHGASHPQSGEESVQAPMVLLSVAPRAKTYTAERNASSAEGVLLVCEAEFTARWNSGTCLDAKENNRWKYMTDSAPTGFKVRGYSFNFVGSGGYRVLTVYYEPIK